MWERYACLSRSVQSYVASTMFRKEFSSLLRISYDNGSREIETWIPDTRHYASAMVEICKKQFGATLNCVYDFDRGRRHAWVTLRMDTDDGSYLYYHDIGNDPFAPDLIPISRKAVELNGLPLEGNCCCFFPNTSSYSTSRRDGASCRDRCRNNNGMSVAMNRCRR